MPRAALPGAEPKARSTGTTSTGLAVLNRAGVLLGEVAGMTEHGAHPLLRVARPAGLARDRSG